MKQKVIVIGHGYLSRLSIIRSVGCLEDCEVIDIVVAPVFKNGVSTRKNIDCYSKYVGKVYYTGRNDEESLVELLLAKCKSDGCKSIIIPDGDFEALAIDRNKEKLQEWFEFPHFQDSRDSVEYWMDKAVQKKKAKELGLCVADSTIVNVENNTVSIPEGIKYPCFCKPLNTVSGGKCGMCRCDDISELQSAITEMINVRPEIRQILVEDFINIEKEFAVVGLSDGENVCVPAVMEFIEGASKMKGIAMTGRISPTGEMKNIIEQFKLFIRKIGFVGLFDVDFFESEGRYYFCELNLRYGGSGEAVTRMGVNLPAMFVESLRNSQLVDSNLEIENTSTYVNDRMCYQDWITNQISFVEMIRLLNSTDFRFIEDRDDRAPTRAFRRAIIKSLINRPLGSILCLGGIRNK